MPFNGSGTAQGVGRPQYPPVSNEVIYAAYFVTIIDDILGMLSNCLTRDGQSAFIQDLPAGGKKFTGLGAGSVPGDSLAWGQALANVASFANGPTFLVAPQVPTGVDKAGGTSAASQQYVEIAVQRGVIDALPVVNANHEALAILTYFGA